MVCCRVDEFSGPVGCSVDVCCFPRFHPLQALTDGVSVVATRCRTDPSQDPPSLYYYSGKHPSLRAGAPPSSSSKAGDGSKRKCVTVGEAEEEARELGCGGWENGSISAAGAKSDDPMVDCVICASEPLFPGERGGSWTLLPKDTMLIIFPKLATRVVPLDLPCEPFSPCSPAKAKSFPSQPLPQSHPSTSHSTKERRTPTLQHVIPCSVPPHKRQHQEVALTGCENDQFGGNTSDSSCLRVLMDTRRLALLQLFVVSLTCGIICFSSIQARAGRCKQKE